MVADKSLQLANFVQETSQRVNFGINVERIETFIDEVTNYLSENRLQEKVIKIDLENMSSGSDNGDEDEIEFESDLN